MFLPIKPYKEAHADFNRAYLEMVLRATKGDVPRAAIAAGHNRTQFYQRLRRAGITPADFRKPKTS